MQIIEHDTEFHIRFEYNQYFKRNTEAVKALPGRTWLPTKKIWRVPAYAKAAVYELQHTHRAVISKPEHLAPESFGEVAPMPELTTDLPLKAELRPYQGQGIARGMELRRLIIGDEQGLGKTLQSIGTVVGIEHALKQAAFPCLVVCPSSTKVNWQREWAKFSNKRAMILNDKIRNTWPQYWNVGMVDVFIVNYESLKKFFVEYMPEKKGKQAKGAMHSSEIIMKKTIDLFKTVIIDESQRCKNPGTVQSKLALRICHKKENVILLSGTPVVNKPVDLFPQLAIMGHAGTFGGKKEFLNRYCEGGSGANNLRELNFLLNQHCFFRREKKDVAKDLPEKQRQTFICDITTRDEYNRAKNEFTKFLKENGCDDAEVAKKLRGEIMVKMGVLKQISARGKLREVKEFTEDILDAGEKLILFCNLHSIVDELRELFPDAVTITGRDDMDTRQRNIDAFQNDPRCQLIICNIKAAGVGITLTASSRVAFVEYPWTYADCVQCEDRAHRIGQSNNVMCTYFLGGDTIDEDLYEMIQEKRHVANTITGATDTMEMNMVDRMLNLFKI
ncbi:DEAD/DEAH box helicase [Chitinophaga sp. YIM B06452]|uniref:DEAD/DEAH box helicase n=1 Tax=Chitinophaga sp. YIM B06452 TaxID=3082158 RepID=UPI0031FEB1CD